MRKDDMTRPIDRLTARGLLFGGDYNPEQWPEEVWDEDVAAMRKAGVTTATVGVFSWALLEPAEGEYRFDWLDRVFATLHDGGIGVVLATPTASPPPWFSTTYPDAMPVRPDGTRLWHGSRDTYCASAPAYRRASRAIARELARRYGRHPALQAWHVHNEYGTTSWSPHAAAAFRTWLQRRYGTLERLNAAWWTAFWSQHYADWGQVFPPVATQYLHNPTQAQDFHRFVSDELLACFTEQRDEIRAASDRPVTTNFMLPSWNDIEQWSWAGELDFLSVDHYLDSAGEDGEAHVAYAGDLVRSWAGGQPWLLMEQASGIVRVDGRMAAKAPGRTLRNSLSYIARGSQGALFFQWRAPAAGAEAWHGGIVPHVGTDSRMYREAVELGRALSLVTDAAQAPEDGPVVAADVAILWHADGWWALQTPQLPSDRLDYAGAVRATHRALWRGGFAVDFARPDADLSRYRVVLVPSMFCLSDGAVAELTRFVEGGGTLLSSYFSGIADEDLHVALGGYPGRLRDLLGVRVAELLPLAEDERVRLSDGGTGELWSEDVGLAGAEAVAAYVGGELDGRPAITRNRRGAGSAWYVSTQLEPPALEALLAGVLAVAGVRPVLGTAPPPGVEVVRRRGRDHDHLFVFNHTAPTVQVRGPGHDLLSGRDTASGIELPTGAAAVVRETPGGAGTWDVRLLEPAG
jgi:beta-galactosidase